MDNINMTDLSTNSSNISIQSDPIYVLVASTIYVLLTVLGVVGNSLVICVVLAIHGMKTSTNGYLLSLAMADILLIISAMPTELAAVHSNDYLYGWVGCALLSFLPYLAINASSLSITSFSIERWLAICYPMRTHIMSSWERSKLINLVIWFLSLLYNSPWLFIYTHIVRNTENVTVNMNGTDVVMQRSNNVRCTFALDRRSYAITYLADFLLFYLVPVIILVLIYTQITIVLVRGPPARLKTSAQGTEGGRSARNRSQVVKMLVIVALVFVLCWLPYRGLVVYNSFAPSNSRFQSVWFLLFAKSCVYLNSAINPVVYNLMSSKFRIGFQRLLRINPTRSISVPRDRGISETIYSVNNPVRYSAIPSRINDQVKTSCADLPCVPEVTSAYTTGSLRLDFNGPASYV